MSGEEWAVTTREGSSNAFLVSVTCLSPANSSPHHDGHDPQSQSALSHLFSLAWSISSVFTEGRGPKGFPWFLWCEMQTVINWERAGGGAYRGAINTDDERGEQRKPLPLLCLNNFKKETNPFCS